MQYFCQDRDLLALEPTLWATGGDGVAQPLLTDDNGRLDGTALTSMLADFIGTGVRPGMVVAVHMDGTPEAECFEILDVFPTILCISVLRASPDEAAIAPRTASDVVLRFHIRTFSAQIRNTSALLAEKLRQTREAVGVRSASFADSAQLRLATACGALADIFVARARDARDGDANWTKAQHYRQEFARMQLALRLAVDADGDGVAEATRTLGNVSLRRI